MKNTEKVLYYCERKWQTRGIFCSSISDCAFEAIYKDAEEDYKEDFWQLICDYRVFERITEETIMNLLSKDSYDVWYIPSLPLRNAKRSPL